MTICSLRVKRFPQEDRAQAAAPRTTELARPKRSSAESVRDAPSFCARRRDLRRTLTIALIVGVLLTLVNQGDVITAGHATTATWIRRGRNFVVPFLVSNAGPLSARHREPF